jgi:hypothetical protein
MEAEGKEGCIPIQTIGPGDYLGWSWLFLRHMVFSLSSIRMEELHCVPS